MKYYYEKTIVPSEIYSISMELMNEYLKKFNYKIIDFRPPKIGELYFGSCLFFGTCYTDTDTNEPRFIVSEYEYKGNADEFWD